MLRRRLASLKTVEARFEVATLRNLSLAPRGSTSGTFSANPAATLPAPVPAVDVMARAASLLREAFGVSIRQLDQQFRLAGSSNEPGGTGNTNGKDGPKKAPDGSKKGSGGGASGGEEANNDVADDLTPKIKLFVFGMFLVSIALYKLAMPRGTHVGWHSIYDKFANDGLRSIDVYDSYAEFSADDGYYHVGLVDDQHTNNKIRGLQAHRDKLVAARLETADEEQKKKIEADTAAGKGVLPPLSYCGTPTAESLLTAFGVFAWIVPFVFFPTVALILTRAVGTAMTVSANAESKSKILKKDFIVHTTSNTRFSQVAGMKEAKREVTEIVEFLKNPGKYTRLGAKIPTGALLMGPPGTGKTLLAKAVAGEAGIGFIPVCGSDFVELYVGMGALRVRQLFEVAKQQRCIVYIDEIDAIGLKRQGSGNGEKQEQEHTLNELLTQLDGFASNRGEIMILASTNVSQDALDPALIRPGRFDRLVHVDAPVISERIDIFKVHLSNLTLIEPPIDTAASADPTDSRPPPAQVIYDKKETEAAKTDAAVDKDASSSSPSAVAGTEAKQQVVILPMHKQLDLNSRLLARSFEALSQFNPVRYLANSTLRSILFVSSKSVPAKLDKVGDKIQLQDISEMTSGSDASAGKMNSFTASMEKIVAQCTSGKEEPLESDISELVSACVASRRFLRELAKSDDSGILPQDYLAFLQHELSRLIDTAMEQIATVNRTMSAADDSKNDGSEKKSSDQKTSSSSSPPSRFFRQIDRLVKSADSYKATISQIRLANAVESVVAASEPAAAGEDEDAKSKRHLAAALFEAIEEQSDRILQISASLMLMCPSSSSKAVASRHSEEKFLALLLQLGEIVLQPPGYELLAPKTSDPSSGSMMPQSAATVQDLERKATAQQAYEFDFTSTLAKKTSEERTLIETFAKRMSDLCPGFVGADIANVCNEGAILAAREKCTTVNISHLERSIDRVIAGIEHRSRRLSDFEKKVVAHHEAGHAVAGWFLNLADPLMKVSIVPRGGSALGYAQYLPNENHLRTSSEVLDSVCVTLGGRVAEQIFFNHLSTGASDDLQKVTKMIYNYVSSFTSSTVRPSPGSDATRFVKPFGANMSNNLDDKAKDLVDQLYKRTFDLLTSKKAEMELLANHLLEHEVLTHADVVRLIGSRQERQPDRKRAA